MFEDFFRMSADIGDGGGGGTVDDVQATADAGGDVSSGEGAAQSGSTPFDYESLAQQFGGPEGMQQALQRYQHLDNLARYNPQARSMLERVLKGEFGPEAQQQAQQQQAAAGGQQPAQQGQQASWLKYDPQTQAQLQSFHAQLQRAKESGDPETAQAIWNDPAFAKAKEAYLAHQQEMNAAWFDPHGFHDKMFAAQAEKRQAEFQQFLQPIQQQFDHSLKEMWVEANPAVNQLPDDIRQAFMNGYYGAGPNSPYAEWKQAIRAAMQAAEQRNAGQQRQPVAQNENGAQTVQNARPNQPQSQNGVKRESQPKTGQDQYREYAKRMVEAKRKDEAAGKS